MADVENPAESFGNLEDLIKENGGLPSRKEMLKMLNSANLTDEMKQGLKNLLGAQSPEIFGHSVGGMMGVAFMFIIFSILFFFGYKLYKSIKDKELKKEEKKKLKQMKKKK